MRHKLTLLAASALLLSSAVQATELDLNFSNSAARLSGSQPLNNNLHLDAGWLHNTDGGNVGHLGVRLVDLATGGQPVIRAGLGARVLYIDSDVRNRSGSAVPLGGTVTMNLPEADRFQVGSYAWFSPDVLSFGSVTRYRELGAYVGYEVLRNGSLYLGVRHVNANFKRLPDATIDSGMHAGMRLRF
jgi:hypothetical protein